MKIKMIILSALILTVTSCTYRVSDLDLSSVVQVKKGGKAYAYKKIKVCAKITYVDANLTDGGHEIESAHICQSGETDSKGIARIEIKGHVTDLAELIPSYVSISSSADIIDVQYYGVINGKSTEPSSVDTSKVDLHENVVLGKIALKFNL
jgi:hypothetical protein